MWHNLFGCLMQPAPALEPTAATSGVSNRQSNAARWNQRTLCRMQQECRSTPPEQPQATTSRTLENSTTNVSPSPWRTSWMRMKMKLCESTRSKCCTSFLQEPVSWSPVSPGSSAEWCSWYRRARRSLGPSSRKSRTVQYVFGINTQIVDSENGLGLRLRLRVVPGALLWWEAFADSSADGLPARRRLFAHARRVFASH